MGGEKSYNIPGGHTLTTYTPDQLDLAHVQQRAPVSVERAASNGLGSSLAAPVA